MPLNMDDLSGKVMVVTGGSRGIGREIVLGAVKRGARVAFCARELDPDARAVKEAAEQIAGEESVIAVQADVSQEDAVDALFAHTRAEFGRVDVVVNNAGITRNHLLATMPVSAWDHVIATNLTGAFTVAQRSITEFLEQKGSGKIIFIGSITQNGAAGVSNYAASKGGLAGLTTAIAQEYGHRKIVVYLLVGGYAGTRLTENTPNLVERIVEASPSGRLASANDIASVVLFLASDCSRAIRNGAFIHVSGGMLEAPVW